MTDDARIRQLERRLARERAARAEAEAIAERVTGELFAATENLQAVNQEMRDFMAVASHDLKNPLTSIVGSASLLRARASSMTTEQRESLLEAIERKGMHMSRMIDDLLTISKIESGAVEPHPASIEIRSAIRQVVSAFLDRSIQVAIVAAEDLRTICDPDHLERMLSNYVSNAIKYGTPPIEIEATRDGEWIDIRVRDTGEGVPETFVPRLFGRFSRAEDEKTQSLPGTGLGLSIVQGLARMNGGDTWYEANEPSGACFAVRLKVAA